jgi:hypothetical protein
MPALTREYFRRLTAPRKELILVPGAGHDTNTPMLEAQYEALQKSVPRAVGD